MQTEKEETLEVNYYGQAKEITVKQGWVTVSLIQRKLRLSYGYTLSLIHALQHKGIIGPADASGKRWLIPGSLAEDKVMQTLNIPTITKASIPSLALQVLDGLLDKAGTILYSSHETIRPGKIYLIGLNPGGSDSNMTLRGNIARMLDETQNAYLDQPWGNYGEGDEGKAPLQQRVQWVLKALGADTRNVLATNLVFSQSRNDTGITPGMDKQCWPVHEALLSIVQPSLIVAFGNSGFSPYGFIHSLYGGSQEYQRAEHGNWNLKRFQTSISGRQTTVIGLPHLSWYRPMGKPSVEAWLKSNQSS